MGNAKHHSGQLESLPPVAGNGLIGRRALLGRGVMFASAATAGIGSTVGADGGRAPEQRGGRRDTRLLAGLTL